MKNLIDLKSVDEITYEEYNEFKKLKSSKFNNICALIFTSIFGAGAVAVMGMGISALFFWQSPTWYLSPLGVLLFSLLGYTFYKFNFDKKYFIELRKLKKAKVYKNIKNLMTQYEKSERFQIEKTQAELKKLTKDLDVYNNEVVKDINYINLKRQIENKKTFLASKNAMIEDNKPVKKIKVINENNKQIKELPQEDGVALIKKLIERNEDITITINKKESEETQKGVQISLDDIINKNI